MTGFINTPYTTAPSAKQMKYAHFLLQTRELPPAGNTDREAWLIARAEDIMGQKTVTKTEVSKVIDYLLSRPLIVR